MSFILRYKERYLEVRGVFLEKKSMYLYTSKCKFLAVYVPYLGLPNALLVVVGHVCDICLIFC